MIDPDPDLVRSLRDRGWVLPPAMARDDVLPAWTRVGVVDAPTTATVDGRGLVTPDGGWSLDWWVGADDRWHLPAREAQVAQARVDGAPVVETRLRVPGGEVVHRAYATRGTPHPGGDEWLVAEVENASSVPVAVAWVVRPLGPAAPAGVHRVDVAPVDPLQPAGVHRVDVDGRPALVLPRRPSRWAAGLGGVDPAVAVLAGDASPGPFPEGGVADPAGLASVALLFPLPHTATLRVALPRAGPGPAPAPPARPPPPGAGVGMDASSPGRTGGGPGAWGWPADLPPVDAVTRGWAVHGDRGPRVELPDPVLAAAVAAARRSLPLSRRVRRVPARTDARPPAPIEAVTSGTGAGPADPAGERMEIVSALARWGHGEDAGRALARWPDDQRPGGGFGDLVATGRAVRAVADHLVATGDRRVAEAWLPELAGAIEHLGRALPAAPRTRSRWWPLRRATPAPVVPPPPDARGRDGTADELAGALDAAVVVLSALGQDDAATRVARDASRAGLPPAPAPSRPAGSSGSVGSSGPSPGSVGDGPGPTGPPAPGGSAAATPASGPGRGGAPTPPGPGSRPADIGGSAATVAPGSGAMTRRSGSGRSVAPVEEGSEAVVPPGSGRPPTPREWAAAALVAARAGEPGDALWALLREASPTWTWSDPRRWEGDDGLIAARLLAAVEALLVHDRPGGPVLVPWLPPTWWGRAWEAHGLPTRWGRLSYAVRWHGDRPAVLWELAGPALVTGGGPVLTAPGLDPTWRATTATGEALLAPVPVPPEVAAAVVPAPAPGGAAVAAPPRSVWVTGHAGPDSPVATGETSPLGRSEPSGGGGPDAGGSFS